MQKIKQTFIKMLTKIVKAFMHLIEQLGGEVAEILNDVGDATVKDIKELETMTIAELRVYAKELDINLEGKRIKDEIIDVIFKNTK